MSTNTSSIIMARRPWSSLVALLLLLATATVSHAQSTTRPQHRRRTTTSATSSPLEHFIQTNLLKDDYRPPLQLLESTASDDTARTSGKNESQSIVLTSLENNKRGGSSRSSANIKVSQIQISLDLADLQPVELSSLFTTSGNNSTSNPTYMMDGVATDTFPPSGLFTSKQHPHVTLQLTTDWQLERAVQHDETVDDEGYIVPGSNYLQLLPIDLTLNGIDNTTTFTQSPTAAPTIAQDWPTNLQVLAEIAMDDIDNDKLEQYTHERIANEDSDNSDEPISNDTPDDNNNNNENRGGAAGDGPDRGGSGGGRRHLHLRGPPTRRRRTQSTMAIDNIAICSSYKIIEVAIAYDSQFCRYFGGREQANHVVMMTIHEASRLYENSGLCLKLKLSHLEGFCNPALDPYATMFSSTGAVCQRGDTSTSILGQFKEFWRTHRQGVQRDVAHLFHGYPHHSTSVGCAYEKSLCDTTYGYGVNELTFGGQSPLFWSLLFAHELGHSTGAYHECCDGYIMDSTMKVSNQGNALSFSPNSLAYMNYFLNLPTTNCLATEAAAAAGNTAAVAAQPLPTTATLAKPPTLAPTPLPPPPPQTSTTTDATTTGNNEVCSQRVDYCFDRPCCEGWSCYANFICL